MSVALLEREVIDPRLTAFKIAMQSGAYEDMLPCERPQRPNSIRGDVNSIITFFQYLGEDKREDQWEKKTLQHLITKRQYKWNKCISRQEMKAKNCQRWRDASKDIRMTREDFELYMKSECRCNAASLFSTTNPSVTESITVRNFIMGEVALCNSNRPDVWAVLKIKDIHSSKVELVNNELQLETADPKTNMTLRLTFPNAILDAI